MNRMLLVWLWISMFLSSFAAKEEFKPYLLLGVEKGSLEEVSEKVKTGLEKDKFEFLGSYNPAKNKDLQVIVITAPELSQAVSQAEDLSAFLLGFRIGFSKTEHGVEVSCMNPPYWGNAYFQKKYQKVSSLIETFEKNLKETLSFLTKGDEEEFGAWKGKDAKKLQSYQYMMFIQNPPPL